VHDAAAEERPCIFGDNLFFHDASRSHRGQRAGYNTLIFVDIWTLVMRGRLGQHTRIQRTDPSVGGDNSRADVGFLLPPRRIQRFDDPRPAHRVAAVHPVNEVLAVDNAVGRVNAYENLVAEDGSRRISIGFDLRSGVPDVPGTRREGGALPRRGSFVLSVKSENCPDE
jgi:hypothetical protein